MEILRLQPGADLPAKYSLSPFKSVLVVEEPTEAAWQAKLSRWLVDSGCLYMMAWGLGCSSWDDSVDIANQEAFGNQEIPDDKFVRTTWHDDEPLKEVFWFAKHTADHPVVELKHTLILHISNEEREEVLAREFEGA